MNPDRIRVAILGATGYTGSELVRLLTPHPGVELVAVTSESRAGEPFSAVHPSFRGIEDRALVTVADLEDMDLDLMFLALPHRVSMEFVRDHGLQRCRIIDLSGDFRLPSAEMYESWYGTPHVAPEFLGEAVFGLPELNRTAIAEARLVANPGCYPTSAILALAPLLKRNQVSPEGIVVDSKSGVTGAGATAGEGTHFPRVFGNFSAYGLLGHRHTPEIEHVLGLVAGEEIDLLFTPHLLPVDRGILTTAYARPRPGVDAESVTAALHEAYADEPFVRVCPTPPGIKDVRGSNYCDVFATCDPRTDRVVTVSVIDNLVKGAAGQAVQNLNIMFDWPETTGLNQGPVNP
ncbi:MAG: N-acetyl-gamma-glutamyl-phosphate reductase [bacterium]